MSIFKRILTYRYKSKWQELIRIHGKMCVYCEGEEATCIDHVTPVNFQRDDRIENLRPCCLNCNLIASDKVFDDFETKKAYILSRRRSRRWQKRSHATCGDCGMPYAYRVHSPSIILCAECYDREYETDYATTSTWAKWIELLLKAGIDVEKHREQANLGYLLR